MDKSIESKQKLIEYLKKVEGNNKIREKLEREDWSKISQLNFNEIKLKDEGVNILRKTSCFKLSVLNLNYNELTNVDNLNKGNWPQLKQLHLYYNQISNINNLYKANWPQLQQIDLWKNQLTNINNLHKANWPQLQYLNLIENKIISKDSVKQKLKQKFPNAFILI